MRSLFFVGAAPVLALLSTSSCGDRRAQLDISFYTQIYADGSCTRRTEYHLTRRGERKEDDPGFEKAVATDPLAREWTLPRGDPWVVTEDVGADRHEAHVEALLPSANEIGWDFFRVRGPGAQPSRNHISFSKDDDEYEYEELLLDPNSPLAAMRQMVDLMERHANTIAVRAAADLGGRHLSAADIRRAYHDQCFVPLRREMALADKAIYGPAERKRLKTALECDKTVEAALLAISPGDPDPIHDALRAADEAMPLEDELLKTGWVAYLAFDAEEWDEQGVELALHATVVMPAPIVRANTCFQGDVAHWDFTQDDLYGRGFDMHVFASAPQPAHGDPPR